MIPPGADRSGSWTGRLLRWFLALVVTLYCGIGGYLYFFQASMVFHPKKGLAATPAAWGLTFAEVRFPSGEESLHGWWIPGSEAGPVVLFFHGNASVISGLGAHVALLHRLGAGVLLFDYRGYGLSSGVPDEEGIYADALAAWSHLTGVLGIAKERIVYYGHSLGGGPALWLATRQQPRGMILEATFLSIPSVGEDRYPYLPIRLLSRIVFDNLERIRGLRAPLLILHSREDQVIGFHHARTLFAAAGEPKRLLETHGSHNTSVNQGGAEVEAGLRAFLEGSASR
ncbi:MAG: alpha/beta hydrolase [Magnetococcales bacterium]|nr:alpha/beta hydrolase [Magnetococcales bacterium]